MRRREQRCLHKKHWYEGEKKSKIYYGRNVNTGKDEICDEGLAGLDMP